LLFGLLSGFSNAKWIDEDGDGKYDVLEVETRPPNFRAVSPVSRPKLTLCD
jgi:hypothetical protein